MKLRFPQGDITISDNSEDAQKIMQGFDFELNNGKLNVKLEKKHYDILDFENKVKKDKHTKQDIDKFLIELVKIYKCIKFNAE